MSHSWRKSIPRRLQGLTLCWVLIAAAGAAAQDKPPGDTPPDPILLTLREALTQGTVTFNLRARAEIAHVDGFDHSEAYTERIRLGYRTGDFYGFSGFVEMEQVQSWNYDLYNAAGLNNQNRRSVIADPEDNELDQWYLKYHSEELASTAIGGRQRIVLDDQRFVGNVGWRQLEQTFDGFLAQTTALEHVTATYAYILDVRRIFGPDADRDWESDSHFFNVAVDTPIGKIVGFAYLLRFSNVMPTATSPLTNSIGGRISNSHELNEDWSLAYQGSYAHQTEGRSNPLNYEAKYIEAQASVTKTDLATGGLRYEVLGSDAGNAAFQTPLATLHKFQGWADAFLTTPVTGLTDLQPFIQVPLPWGLQSMLAYHVFHQESGSSRLGSEWDARLAKKINENWSALAKFAYFNGTSNGPSDRVRYWLETTFSF